MIEIFPPRFVYLIFQLKTRRHERGDEGEKPIQPSSVTLKNFRSFVCCSDLPGTSRLEIQPIWNSLEVSQSPLKEVTVESICKPFM